MRQRRRASVHEGEEAVLDAIEDMGHDSQDSDGDEDEMDDDSDRSSLDSTRSTATASSLSALSMPKACNEWRSLYIVYVYTYIGPELCTCFLCT